MPSIEQYRRALEKAEQDGDTEAINYFATQIEQTAKKGTILDPIFQGATLGFGDEIAGGISGTMAAMGGGDFSKAYDDTTTRYREDLEAYRQRNPVTSFAAELGGGLLLPFGAVRTMAARPIASATGLGATYGLGSADTNFDPTAEGTDYENESKIAKRISNTIAGGATGFVGGQVMSKLGRAIGGPKTAPVPKYTKDRVKILEKNNIPTTAAERLGDNNARMSTDILTRQGYLDPSKTANRESDLYSKLMRRAGFDSKDVKLGELTPSAVDRANNKFTRRYDDVLAGVDVNMDTIGTIRQLHNIRNEFSELMPFEQKSNVSGIIDDLQNMVQSSMPRMSGRDYKRIRSLLRQRQQGTSDQTMKNFYRSLKQTMDNSFRSAVPPDVANKLAKIDSDYAMFKTLEKGAKTDGRGFQTLFNEAFKNRRNLPKDFYDLIESYNHVVMHGLKSSGTAENIAAGQFLPRSRDVINTSRAAFRDTIGENMRDNFVSNNARMVFPGMVGSGTPLGMSLQGMSAGIGGPEQPLEYPFVVEGDIPIQ